MTFWRIPRSLAVRLARPGQALPVMSERPPSLRGVREHRAPDGAQLIRAFFGTNATDDGDKRLCRFKGAGQNSEGKRRAVDHLRTSA